MPEVMIDESELENYKSLTGFIQKALANPKTRESILRAQKTLNPDASIPELDAAEPLRNELTAMREEMKTFREETLREKQDRDQAEKMSKMSQKWEQGRDRVRAQGYSEDGIKAVEALMENEGILNHEAGLAYFERLNPPSDPIAVGSSRFDLFGQKEGDDDFMKSLMESGGDMSVFDKGLNKILQDVRTSGKNR